MRSAKRRALLPPCSHMCIYLFKAFRLLGGFLPIWWSHTAQLPRGRKRNCRRVLSSTRFTRTHLPLVWCVSTGSCPRPSCKPCSPSAECVPTAAWEQRSAPSSEPFGQPDLLKSQRRMKQRLPRLQVSRIADSEDSVMLMLGRCLPHIVPNVLLAKREVSPSPPALTAIPLRSSLAIVHLYFLSPCLTDTHMPARASCCVCHVLFYFIFLSFVFFSFRSSARANDETSENVQQHYWVNTLRPLSPGKSRVLQFERVRRRPKRPVESDTVTLNI